MTTNLKSKTPSSSINAYARRLIGIFVTLPGITLWTAKGVEIKMLSAILTGALQRRSLFIPEGGFIDRYGRINMAAFEGGAFGIASVTDCGSALDVVAGELSAIDLIDGAHLAWCDFGEGIWRH